MIKKVALVTGCSSGIGFHITDYLLSTGWSVIGISRRRPEVFDKDFTELATRAITVNVVSPAATDTSMLHDPKRAGNATVLPPFGRYVKPEEIAGTVAFLLSDVAAAMTGQQLVVCAGSSL